MKKLCLSSFALIMVLFLTNAAFATIIVVDSVSASWSNNQPNPGVPPIVITPPPPGPTDTIRWGTPASAAGQSGYDFTAQKPVALIDVPPTSQWLDFGDFVHINQPITGDPLTSVVLTLLLDLTVGGTPVNGISFNYTFHHEETPNAFPCDYGATNGPCDDRVTIDYPSAGTFLVAGVLYTLELGFMDNPGDPIINTFVTGEGLDSEADLFGRFTANLTPVPEPATMLLLGSGLLGLAGYGRKKLFKK